MPFIDLNSNNTNPAASTNPAGTTNPNPSVVTTTPVAATPLPVNPNPVVTPDIGNGVRQNVGASWNQTSTELNKVQDNLASALIEKQMSTPVTTNPALPTAVTQSWSEDQAANVQPVVNPSALVESPNFTPINQTVNSVDLQSQTVTPIVEEDDNDLAEVTLGTELTDVVLDTQPSPESNSRSSIQAEETKLNPDPILDIVPAVERKLETADTFGSKETNSSLPQFEEAKPIVSAVNSTAVEQQLPKPVMSSWQPQTNQTVTAVVNTASTFSKPSIPATQSGNASTEATLAASTVESKPTVVAPLPELTSVKSQDNLQSKVYNLTDLLKQAVENGASDLHLTADYRAMVRVDGKLVPIQSQILTHQDIVSMLEEVVADHPHVDLRHDLDIDVSYALENPAARFRVNIFYQRNTIGAVFRLIPAHIRTVDELRLPAVIKEFTGLPTGLVLVTGPTGSGKTTTLAALVNSINTSEPKHIITIEDPIEYVYPKGIGLVDQRAVFIDTPDWRTALRAVLRQDPNVVLIGEMRDTETMEAALTIAETGHLVFSTLHTNSASQTIDRIIDAFPEEKQSQVRTQLASVLMAVVSQRLIPVSGGGRRVAAEIMVVTPAVRNSIREQKVYQIDNIIQTSADLGMVTMEKSLVGLVREGAISPEAAQNYANRPEDVLTYLSKN